MLDFKFNFSTDKPIADQMLYHSKEFSLVSILKLYTNNSYFALSGIYFCNNKIIEKWRCKDRGGIESLVDDKEACISFMKSYFYNAELKFINAREEQISDSIKYIYDENNNYIGSRINYKGLWDRGFYDNKPTEKDMSAYEAGRGLSYSNTYTYVNAAFNNIKIVGDNVK